MKTYFSRRRARGGFENQCTAAAEAKANDTKVSTFNSLRKADPRFEQAVIRKTIYLINIDFN